MPLHVTSLFLTLLLMACPGFGWGVLGHRVVADLAQDMLTPEARSRAAALLGPPSGGGAGGEGFRLGSISVWADDIRSLRPETRPWHYITLQIGEPRPAASGRRVRTADTPNVVTALEKSLAVLADTSADRYAREEALKWVVHLVGDLHQPLHVGEDRDKGGNLTKVKVGRRTRNLHEVWDYVLLERLGLPSDSLRALLARAIAADPAFISRNAKGTAEDWVEETHAKTRNCYLLHGKPLKKGVAVQLDRTYLRPNALVALEQLKIAAVRLALVLNASLDPSSPSRPALPVRVPAGWREDTAAYFAAPAGKADSGESPAPRPRRERPAAPESSAKYAWSANSQVYHIAGCAHIARIKAGNLRRGSLPPPHLTLHSGCPRTRR